MAGDGDGLGREQFSTVMSVVPDPVFATDRRGYVSYVNRAFVEQFGVQPDDGVDVHVSDFLVDDAVETVVGLLREMVRDASNDDTSRGGFERRTVELRGVSKSGRTRAFEASVAPFPSDGSFVGVAAVLHDVSARQRREAVFTVMDRALRHNLRSNVSVITGYADVLEDAVGDEHADPISEIRGAAEWIQKLGSSFRTLQQAIEETFAHDESVSVERVVESAVASARRENPDANVSVHFSARGDLQAGPAVEQAVVNVVENAIVHNDSDPPTVEVWVAHASRDGWVDVHVADDGPGIPDFEREIVLGEASIDQFQHGSGIGLWITRWVVEVFDGELAIDDNDPTGTVVTMQFPLIDDA